MIWCIESSSFGVDIHLLFQENLTIGQKIALTEKIVAVLPKMNCPYQIEPHQIQGLDCIHIFPVIKWLIKQSIKTREEMAQNVRLFAINQFRTKYKYTPSMSKVIEHIKLIKKTYNPRRCFKQKQIILQDEFSIVRNTILEYGEVLQIPQSAFNLLQEMECNISLQDTEITKEIVEQTIQEKSKSEELMRNLSTFEDESNHLSWNFVEKFVDIQAREIDKVTNKSASSCSQFEDYKTSITTLLKQIFILKNKIEKLIQDKLGLNREVHHVMNHLYEIRNKKIVMNFQIIENLEMHQNKELLRMMEVLLIIYDGLKNQENKFRERCRINLLTLKKLSENTQKEQPYKENNFALEHENQKVVINQLRLQLARKNRLIATLTRQLDDVPCRSELFQYQRRFMELYNEVSTKHKETKQYYTLYNTLDDTKIYLNKELCLLNSIQDSYNQALAYNNGREQFVKQFELIVEGVQRNKIKIQNRCAEGKSRRDICSQQLTILMDQQRKYIAAVRELTTACRENETLLAQLRRL
ncbi:coiled-coil domain-containing protein 93 isoform X2 [Phymastichus coffea]|nr:coiled-coil domain-containing protein 93 isoform X2 [Phymastichus coffea]